MTPTVGFDTKFFQKFGFGLQPLLSLRAIMLSFIAIMKSFPYWIAVSVTPQRIPSGFYCLSFCSKLCPFYAGQEG